MQNLQQVGVINEAPPQAVASDTAQDTDLQLLEKHARRQGVQTVPEPPTTANPLANKIAVLWVYICINEGQHGVSILSNSLASQWLRNGHLVSELRNLLNVMHNVVIGFRSPRTVDDFVYRDATHGDINIPGNWATLYLQTVPKMALWQCLVPLVNVIKSKITYLDLKENEHNRPSPTALGMMAVETADPSLPADLRRLSSYQLQLARQNSRNGHDSPKDRTLR